MVRSGKGGKEEQVVPAAKHLDRPPMRYRSKYIKVVLAKLRMAFITAGQIRDKTGNDR